MTEMPRFSSFDFATALAAPMGGAGLASIGVVLSIAGSSSRVVFDRGALEAAAVDADPVAANAGQVGCQIKMRVGSAWIVANVRSLELRDIAGTQIVADIDFLGEGDEERLTGKLYN